MCVVEFLLFIIVNVNIELNHSFEYSPTAHKLFTFAPVRRLRFSSRCCVFHCVVMFLQVFGLGMDEKAEFATFAGSRFHNWKFRMETVLDMYGLCLLVCVHQKIAEIGELREMADDSAQAKFVKEKQMVERSAAEKKCKAIIISAIAYNQLELVKVCASP